MNLDSLDCSDPLSEARQEPSSRVNASFAGFLRAVLHKEFVGTKCDKVLG
jgi:hypothetical protein